ncbi:MAG: hypothetical protein ABW352_26010, partial [Polyangiales bacterium]
MMNLIPRSATRRTDRMDAVNLPTLWRELAAGVAEPAASKGLTVDLRMADDAVMVGDADALARVFRILLSSAVHLSARDTCITVSVHSE